MATENIRPAELRLKLPATHNMFSLREKLIAIFTINGFCDETQVNNAISKALAWCQANKGQSVKDWFNLWYGHAL